MARTINFDFAQGGGSTISSGRVGIGPTQTRVEGSTVIVPSLDWVTLVDGTATITDVEPTPTAVDGWRYQVRVESSDNMIHTWIVEVPDGTTPINFSALPVVEGFTLPLLATGVIVEQWIDSVRSHAAAAGTDAVNALQGVEDLQVIIDGLDPGAGGVGIPTGGSAGQVLAKVSATDFDVEWVAQTGGGGTTLTPPVVLTQSSPDQTIFTFAGKLGEPHQTTNANLVEWRNGVPSDGDPSVGRLVTYINEEGLLRVQNSLNNKTIFRIRNWGTNCNAIQVTNDSGSEVLFNVTGEGIVTAANIGEPIRAILGTSEEPAPGMPEGIYLRRTV